MDREQLANELLPNSITTHMNKLLSVAVSATVGIALAAVPLAPALADTIGPITFESPTYSVGNINGQDGWTSTGAYDQGVVSSPVISGSQSFRISNAVTSGSFGDQTFSKPLVDSAGETGSDSSGFPQGTLQSHFESQFTIEPISGSIGDVMSVSPDTGNGGRMSYLSFDNENDGVHVTFYDVQGTSNPANFVPTSLGVITSTAPHTIKFSMDFVNGPSNDVVKIYIDGTLVHTGTSWENYYRFDSESNPSLNPNFTHSVRTMLFREGGTAVSANSGKGFLIDDLSLMSSTPPSTVTVTIDKFIDGAMATAAKANSSAFPMASSWNATNIGSGSGTYALGPTGFNSPNAYEAVTADMTSGASYTTNEVTGGDVVGATCADGKPFALVGYTTGDTPEQAAAATPSATVPSFTNLQSNHYVIVWNQTCPTTGSVSGMKFWDINGNGVKDTGEPGLSGWTINLAGPTTGSQVTGAAGAFGFTSLVPGAYTLTETMKPGWTQTKAPGPVTLAAGQNITGQDFGNACFVSTNGKGIGYWTNKNGQAVITGSDLSVLSGLNLVNAAGTHQTFTAKSALATWLLNATATNMAYMLSAQLAAVQLSVAHGTNGNATVVATNLLPFAPITGLSPLGTISINNLIAAANASLGANPNTPAGNSARAYQEALKNALEKVASGSAVQVCNVQETFTASDSSYYNGPTNASPLYANGPITFTWDPNTGNVTSGLYEEIAPATSGTHYFNNVTGGTVSGNNFTFTFNRTIPNSYSFTGSGTLSGNTFTGTLDGPYLFTATGTVTP